MKKESKNQKDLTCSYCQNIAYIINVLDIYINIHIYQEFWTVSLGV